MNLTGAILTLLLASFTGWVMTLIAVKMLFHPKRAIKVFGITIQGIFAKNQLLIEEKIGQVVGRELLSFEEIENKITSTENLQKLRPEIEIHIDHFLRSKLKDVFPMASMLGEKSISQLKQAFLIEVETLFPVIMKTYMDKLQHDLNLEKIVTDRVAGFSSGKLENILNEVIKREVKFLQIIGAILGLMIGFVQLALSYLIK
ncbi:MAG: DUF445 family protein [Ferruginibacter sp.]